MKFFQLLFISNIWLSLGAVGLSLFIDRSMQLESPRWLFVMIFCFFMMIYNVHGLVNAKARLVFDTKLIHYYKSPAIPWIIIINLLICTSLLMQCRSTTQWSGVCFIIIGLLYGSKIIPLFLKGKKIWMKPKNIPFLKAFVITIAIACIVAGLPLLEQELNFYDMPPMVLVFIALHIFSNTVIGDIRDIKIDKRDKCHTIATFMGMHSTRIFLFALNLVFMLLLFRRWEEYRDVDTLAMSAATIVTLLSLLVINRKFRFVHYHFLDVNHFVPWVSLLVLEKIY